MIRPNYNVNPYPEPRRVRDPIHLLDDVSISKLCTKPLATQAIAAPINMMYIGIPSVVINVAATMEKIVIAMMSGRTRIPEFVGLAPRIA